MFGHFEDGLTGYNKLRPESRKEYLLHPLFSKQLIIRNINKAFAK
jgi:hypothetical protein